MFFMRFQELMILTFPKYFSDSERQPLSEELEALMEPKSRTRAAHSRYISAYSRYYAHRPRMESF